MLSVVGRQRLACTWSCGEDGREGGAGWAEEIGAQERAATGAGMRGWWRRGLGVRSERAAGMRSASGEAVETARTDCPTPHGPVQEAGVKELLLQGLQGSTNESRG